MLYSRSWSSSGNMFAVEPKVRGFKPGRGQWIFKGDKISSTTSFRGEVKPSVPCRRFTVCYKNPASMKEILRRQYTRTFVAKFLPASLLDVSADNCQRALVDESGMIKNSGREHIDV
jgi:hypothetical protein